MKTQQSCAVFPSKKIKETRFQMVCVFIKQFYVMKTSHSHVVVVISTNPSEIFTLISVKSTAVAIVLGV